MVFLKSLSASPHPLGKHVLSKSAVMTLISNQKAFPKVLGGQKIVGNPKKKSSRQKRDQRETKSTNTVDTTS